MASRYVLTPYAAELPATVFPQLQLVNRRPVLSFDASALELANWTVVAPQGITTPLTAVINYFMATAATGTAIFEVTVEAVTEADALDLAAADSFDAVNSITDTVPGTLGNLGQGSITLTNNDAIAAGDYVRFRLRSNGGTAVNDRHVLFVEIRDNA